MKLLVITSLLVLIGCGSKENDISAIAGPTPTLHGIQNVFFTAIRNGNSIQNGVFNITNQISMTFPLPSEIVVTSPNWSSQIFSLTVVVHGILCTYSHGINSPTMNSTTCPIETIIVVGDSILFTIDPNTPTLTSIQTEVKLTY